MISLEPNYAGQPLNPQDMIPMSRPEPNLSTKQESHQDHIKNFDEFVDEPLHTAPEPKCWSIEFFKPYFDVTTLTVLHRMRKAMLPISADAFFPNSDPDLYGPFWIITTLVCAVTMAGNEIMKEEGYNVSLLVTTATVLYSMVIVVPVVASCLMRGSGRKVRTFEFLSLYCYSYLVFIPVTILCAFFTWWVDLVLLIVATFWSLTLTVQNYYSELRILEGGKRTALVAVLFGGHLTFLGYLIWYLVFTNI